MSWLGWVVAAVFAVLWARATGREKWLTAQLVSVVESLDRAATALAARDERCEPFARQCRQLRYRVHDLR